MSSMSDVRLLFLMAMLSSLLLALNMLLIRRLNPELKGVSAWQTGSAISALGFCLVSLRGVVPDALSIVLANGLGVLGTARTLRGMREALDLPPLPAVEWLAAGAAALICLVFTYVEPSLSARIRGVSLSFLLLGLYGMATAFGRQATADANRWAWRSVGLIVLVASTAHLLRLLSFPDHPQSGQDYMAVRQTQEAVLLAVAPAYHLTLMFALTFVVATRVVGSLRRSEGAQRDLVQRLRDSEQQLQTLIAQAPMAIAMLDRELRYIVASGHWQQRMAATDMPLAGHRVGEHRRVLLPPGCISAQRRVLDGETVSGHSDALHFAGEPPRLFDWTASPWRGPDGTVGGLILCVEEVTERERAVAALRESNSKFASVFETGLVGMAINSLPDGRFIDINSAWLQLLGYERSQIVGRTGDELQLWTDPGLRTRTLDALKQDGRITAVEAQLRRADGRTVDALFSANCVRADGRQLFVSILADVSALKAAQRSLQAQKQDLEQTVALRTRDLAQALDAAEAANRTKSAFLANMSHEIRTPLNGILGMAYLVRSSGVTPVQQQRLDQLEGAGRHLLQVINDVLDLSKIEAGGLVLEERHFLAAELEALVSAVVVPLAAAKGLRLAIDLTALPAELVGDSARLAQALINLLSNGIKFTDAGVVTLRAMLRRLDREGCELEFEVQDTGIGMSDAQMAQIFRPFGQADSSVTRRYGGTGLGLVITQRLAELMGGSVTVSSQPGAGSCFCLQVRLGLPPTGTGLPAADPPDLQAARRSEAALRARLAGRPVLVVEDDLLSRSFMADLLDDMGLAHEAAGDGGEAVACAAARPYAVILMDLHMPTLGGAEATQRIRALPAHAHTPIVAITADAGEEQRAECLRTGFDAVLHKPLVPAQLVEVLLRVVPEPDPSPGL
ncbi:ATP-binding protein [Ideonella sp. DXS22W]|uniref:histidine kinase n=1 Tax=Pseudaquabacterium inlustre TaxID=2984192 RepID=A0ABU9CGE9_9BURK